MTASQASQAKTQKKNRGPINRLTPISITKCCKWTRRLRLNKLERLSGKKLSKCIQIEEETPKNSKNCQMLIKYFPTLKKDNSMMNMESKESKMEALQEALD